MTSINAGSMGISRATSSNTSGGTSAASKVAVLMKKITGLQKQASELKGSPEEVSKQSKLIQDQIKLIQMQIQQIMAQEAQKNQETQTNQTLHKVRIVPTQMYLNLG
jgi:chromosome segregation ATPase